MKKIILTLCLLSATAVITQAALVLSDTFTYPDGPIVGAAGSPWSPHSGTLEVNVVNNTIQINTTNSQDINALLQGGPYTTNSPTVLYSSFQVTFTALPTVAFGVPGGYFAHFKDNNEGAATGFGGRVFASIYDAVTQTALTDPSKFRLGIGNGSQTEYTSGQLTNDLTTNVTYTVVTRFDPSNGLARIWLNPGDETDYSVQAIDDGINGPGTVRDNRINIYSYAFRQAAGEGVMFIDNLKVGTFFYDVAGTNTPPLISSIAGQSIPADGSTPAVAFTVQDDNTPAGSLVLSNYSDNPALVPNSGGYITFGGSGTNRTITVSSATGQQGLATIHVYATDNVYTSEVSFQVKVGYPYISPIANQITVSNVATPAISFTVGDAESAASSLTLLADSSNPTLLPTGNIAFGGSASNRTVTLTPVAGEIGVSTVTIYVSDGARTNTSVFKLTARPLIGVLLTENFNYTSFSLSTTNSLYLADGSPWTHASGGFFQILVSNSAALIFPQSNGENVARALTNGPYQGSNGVVLYSGFTVNFKSLPKFNGGDNFAQFRDSASGITWRARVIASTNNAAPGQFRFGLANNSGFQSAQYSKDLNLNQKYVVVTRCNFATGEGWLWLNPISETGSENIAATDNLTSSQGGQYGIRQTTASGYLELDNLVVATSFASVLPALPSGTVTINAGSAGGNVILSWTDPTGLLYLQSAPDLAGPYTDVPNATNPYTNTASGQLFFRLKY